MMALAVFKYWFAVNATLYIMGWTGEILSMTEGYDSLSVKMREYSQMMIGLAILSGIVELVTLLWWAVLP